MWSHLARERLDECNAETIRAAKEIERLKSEIGYCLEGNSRYVRKVRREAVAAEKASIVARLREMANADDPPRTTIHYNAKVRQMAKFFREAASMIERGEGERG